MFIESPIILHVHSAAPNTIKTLLCGEWSALFKLHLNEAFCLNKQKVRVEHSWSYGLKSGADK